MSDEVIACRVCLAADGRLYAISGSGLEDSLVTLTGIAMPAVDSFPRHLCVFCMAKLSKCVAFRDSCQRSTALLQILLVQAPLKMNAIEAFNQKSQQLVNNLTCEKVFDFGTDPFIEIMPLIKTENNESSHEEMEYQEREDFIKKYSSNIDVDLRTNNIECIKVEMEIENKNAHSEIDDCIESEFEMGTSDVDTDISEETFASKITRKRKSISSQKENTAEGPKKYGDVETEADHHHTSINTDAPEETIGKNKVRKKVGIKPSGPESGFKKKNNRKTKPVGKEEQKQGLEERKKNKSAFSCDMCGKEFKKESTLMTHTTRHNKNSSRKTRATLKEEADLALEKNYNFEVKMLSKEEQKQKIEEMKSNRSASGCDVCGKECFRESSLLAHKTSCHDSSLPLECDVCPYRFRSRHNLQQHQDRHRAVYTCNECGNIFRKRTFAKEHYLMHKGKKYTCPYCQRKYNRQNSYYLHIKTRHSAENEPCDQCGETFAGTRGLLVHKRIRHRANDKPNEFKCKDCDVKFSNPEALQRHLELSAGVPHAALWPCAACGDSCGSEPARDKHAADKHPPEQLHCKECNETVSNAASFALHEDLKHKNRWRPAKARTRNRHGRFVCEICGKVLMCKKLLEYHMNGHLGLEPFQCPHCPKGFAHKTRFMLHMRVHTGKKPYQCEQCPLAFSRSDNFARHVQNVHLRVQVECDKCGKTVGASSLTSHVRAVHMNQPYVRRKRNRTKKTARVTESCLTL